MAVQSLFGFTRNESDGGALLDWGIIIVAAIAILCT